MSNQASEDELRVKVYNEIKLWLSPHESLQFIDDFMPIITSLIRTEKLKLLDRISSHQEDLFWWTGGEYEKTKAVDMRAIEAERKKLAIALDDAGVKL